MSSPIKGLKTFLLAHLLTWVNIPSVKKALTLNMASPMDFRPRIYIITAFFAGVLLTLGFKDLYPDLERRFRRHRRLRRKRYQQARNSTIVGAGLDKSCGAYNDDNDDVDDNDDDDDDEGDPIGLEDHTRNDDPEGSSGTAKGRRRHEPDAMVPDGIEACVGNTPLFRIKSLSEETGCEIWAKAEVNLSFVDCKAFIPPTPRRHYDYLHLTIVVRRTVYEWGRRESQGQSSFEYYQRGK